MNKQNYLVMSSFNSYHLVFVLWALCMAGQVSSVVYNTPDCDNQHPVPSYISMNSSKRHTCVIDANAQLYCNVVQGLVEKWCYYPLDWTPIQVLMVRSYDTFNLILITSDHQVLHMKYSNKNGALRRYQVNPFDGIPNASYSRTIDRLFAQHESLHNGWNSCHYLEFNQKGAYWIPLPSHATFKVPQMCKTPIDSNRRATNMQLNLLDNDWLTSPLPDASWKEIQDVNGMIDSGELKI